MGGGWPWHGAAVLQGMYEKTTGIEVGFLQWMKMGVPVVALMLPITWLWLTRKLAKTEEFNLPWPGPWQSEQRPT